MTRQNPVAARSGRDDLRPADDGLSLAELEAERGTVLPDREAFATIPSDPSTALLDVFIDLDAALDLAAPINAALAANANVALPIDAAVSANALSPGSISIADANQTSIIEQVLQADATASSNQDSAIMQGEGGGTASTEAGGQTGELESAPLAGAPMEPAEQVAPEADTEAIPVEQVAPVADTAAGPAPVEQIAPVPADPTRLDPAADAALMAEAETAPAPAAAVATPEPEIAPGAAEGAEGADGSTATGTVSDIDRSAPPAMTE
jgi:hypothetical protein